MADPWKKYNMYDEIVNAIFDDIFKILDEEIKFNDDYIKDHLPLIEKFVKNTSDRIKNGEGIIGYTVEIQGQANALEDSQTKSILYNLLKGQFESLRDRLVKPKSKVKAIKLDFLGVKDNE